MVGIWHFDPARAANEHGGIDYHRRLGSMDEWKSIFTVKQIEEINAAIPKYFWGAFDWKS